ncbi:LysR family transcriptional regulator [Paraburkholderia sp. SOS3]|uniref:LysR family transcriptional regulator n=1 Tax=Paraburkholderia sp. SOS3 TaxID=1926494 RepID=UPI00094756C8|nr:LysR family transcriptional regulator [Paraburkholderia sp. SOS3]APR37460.1 LysR family transcriptional regulator [Paraburkholderia sp. SOS3]
MPDIRARKVDWEDVRIFAALVRHGSLTAAARALAVTHATVARRVASLEHALGETLVERRPDGYVLTEAGTRAISTANEMETAAATLVRGGRPDGPRGLVRLSATPALAERFLAPSLAVLTAQQSALDVELASDLRDVSLERREADIVLRFGPHFDDATVSTRIATLDYGFYANAEWKQRVENGVAPVFIGFDEANADIPDAWWLSTTYPRARIALRANNQAAQAAIAGMGAGIALLPHFIGRTDRLLVPCALSEKPPSRELWLVRRRQESESAAISTVCEFLMNQFKQERALFEDR